MDTAIEVRLDTLEKTVGDLIARYNASVPLMRQVVKLPDLMREWGKDQIKFGEQMNGYLAETARLLELLQEERDEAEKRKAGT